MFNLAFLILFTMLPCLRDGHLSPLVGKIQPYDLMFPFYGFLCCCQIQMKGERWGIASSRSVKKKKSPLPTTQIIFYSCNYEHIQWAAATGEAHPIEAKSCHSLLGTKVQKMLKFCIIFECNVLLISICALFWHDVEMWMGSESMFHILNLQLGLKSESSLICILLAWNEFLKWVLCFKLWLRPKTTWFTLFFFYYFILVEPHDLRLSSRNRHLFVLMMFVLMYWNWVYPRCGL